MDKYIPEQGDLVYLTFDPSADKEIQKRRPAFVVSKKIFNEKTGFALVMPITSTHKNLNLEICLNSAKKISGTIVTHQIRSLDFLTREMVFVEKASKDVKEHALKTARLIVS